MRIINEFKKEEVKRDLDSQQNAHSLMIPSFVFKDRRLKVLEVLVEYLKEKREMSYHEIAVLLNRDDRTIWTTYQKAKKK